MKALVKTAKGPGHVELKSDWPKPVARPSWVVVEVVASGICGTDVHILEDTHKNWPPVVLGHEYTGRIVEVGSDCGEWKVGDRIVCEQHTLACMNCDACRRGAIHLCPSKRSPGWGIDGAFAEFVLLPAHLLHKVPDGVSFRTATVTEPTAICITGIDRAGIAVGEKVVVVGPGPIGLISAMLVKAAGASDVVLVGRASSAKRLEIAQSLGIRTYTLSDNESAIAALGETFDLAIDSTGAGESLTLCARVTRRLGRILELGLANQSEVPFNINAATTKSITIFTSLSSEYSSWDRALAFMAAKKYDPAVLTSIYSLDQWEQAFDDVESRKVVKGVITPQDFSVLDQVQ
jgi:L-iditol 2-dehydrogenase